MEGFLTGSSNQEPQVQAWDYRGIWTQTTSFASQLLTHWI